MAGKTIEIKFKNDITQIKLGNAKKIEIINHPEFCLNTLNIYYKNLKEIMKKKDEFENIGNRVELYPKIFVPKEINKSNLPYYSFNINAKEEIKIIL